MSPSEVLEKRLRLLLKNTTDRKQLHAVGKMAVIMIKRRTRQGYGIQNGKRVKLKPLAESYIAKRRRMRLSSKTSPAKSNLTLTGEMIDSLIHRIEEFIVIVEVADSQKAKAEYAQDERPFLGLTSEEINTIRDHLLTGAKR